MRAALVFVREATEHRFELSEDLVMIGRGSDCELRVADDRVSTQHCRVSRRDDAWWVEDLGSTNRTFVNGEPLSDKACRLRHGDALRLGARDAKLFEARFVLLDPGEQHRAAAQQVVEGVQRRNLELEAELATRIAEIHRLGVLCAGLQTQLASSQADASAAKHVAVRMTSEIDELHGQLTVERNEHAGCRDRCHRAEKLRDELQSQLAAVERQVRRVHDDADRSRKELEARLRAADAELATVKAALATSTANVSALQQAHNDVLLRLDALGIEP